MEGHEKARERSCREELLRELLSALLFPSIYPPPLYLSLPLFVGGFSRNMNIFWDEGKIAACRARTCHRISIYTRRANFLDGRPLTR